MNWHLQVSRFVTLKRRVGLKYEENERRLRAYAQYASEQGDQVLNVKRIVNWAATAPSVAGARARLTAVRRFAIWMHAEDERHEIPPTDALGRARKVRPAVRILTTSEIRRLMEAALLLGPAGSITPYTFHYVFGLMAATGLRRSEAVSLKLQDITSDGLIVRETKFGKTRLVPIHNSVHTALDTYLRMRIQVGAQCDHLFVLATGRPPTPNYITCRFILLARQIGLRGEGCQPGPRLHDLRFAFAARSLEACAHDRNEVSRHMLALTTYLGHGSVSNTYWYLEPTPVLLQAVSDASEQAQMRRTGR